MVKNKALAQQLEGECDQKNQIRGIAGLNDIESSSPEHFEKKSEFVEQRHTIFGNEGKFFREPRVGADDEKSQYRQ